MAGAPAAPERAVLVLGAQVGPGGQPSAALRRRALHGAALLRSGRAAWLVACGGTGRHGPPSEAAAIAAIARAAGVGEHRIRIEDRSTSTEENLRFARPILAALGDPPVVIVTDRFHAPRALFLARAMGLRATADCPPPSGTPPLRRLWPTLREGAALARTLWRAARGRYRPTAAAARDPRGPAR